MERHAAETALSYIKEEMTIGLGSGRTIEYLLEFLAMKNLSGLKIVTGSMATAIQASQRNLNVVPTWMVDHIDYTFDEVSYAAKDLSALKKDSTLLIHNKLIASMADHFVILVAKDDFAAILTDGLPVQVEVIKPAFSYVQKRLADMNAEVTAYSVDVDHPYVSALGNYILQAKFEKAEDLKALDLAIKSIPGVVDTSLFTNLNTMAIIYGADGVEIEENASA